MILLDPQDRVLLIEEAGSEAGRRWHHWLTPGGGVEPGESLTEAATREVIEETGLRVQLPPNSVPVHTQQRRWGWQGVTYDQLDHIFAARVGNAFEAHPSALTAMERQTVQGWRWWSVAELTATTDTVLPKDLAAIVTTLVEADDLPRPTVRAAGRVLVLDGDGHLLLINARQSPTGAATNWIAPGGGVEAGERPVQAAQRELFEETGIPARLADVPPVTTERAVFWVGDWHLDQRDDYFVWPVTSRPEIDRSRLTELERRTVLAYRWWTAAELADTDELFWPANLVQILSQLTRQSPRPSGSRPEVT